MVLARLAPRWVSGVAATPQGWALTDHPGGVAVLARYSLLLRASLTDLFGSDYPGYPRRGEVTWVYWSYRAAQRLLVKSFVGLNGIATVGDLWPCAEWLERELWEMFGVPVRGHPDLRRLVTDYGFVGHPLQKDFPVVGYLEVRYSELARRVVSRPVGLTQEFRAFDFRSPWHT